MSRTTRVILLVGALVVASVAARAQFVVLDPLALVQNTAIAALRRQISELLNQQVAKLQDMARRLSAFTDLQRYATHDTPEWRIHLFQFEQYLFANGFNAALNYGDRSGAGFSEVARARVEPGVELEALAGVDPTALATIQAQLATLDLADSTIVIGTDQTGQLRYNGRKEQEAIDALEADGINASTGQSTAAVLDKMSGASLIRARQQQARLQFISAVIEQLVVDNKRSRDTEAAAMNMRLGALRDGRAAGHALLAGAADDLRTWRQP